MQRWKRSRYLYILGIAIASLIASSISPIIPTALADTLTPARVNFEDKNLPFVRINRTVIKVGEAFFYSDDPTREENNSYTAVGLDCPAKLTYNHETVSSEGVATLHPRGQLNGNALSNLRVAVTQLILQPREMTTQKITVRISGTTQYFTSQKTARLIAFSTITQQPSR